jgi:hypothetical protein
MPNRTRDLNLPQVSVFVAGFAVSHRLIPCSNLQGIGPEASGFRAFSTNPIVDLGGQDQQYSLYFPWFQGIRA